MARDILQHLLPPGKHDQFQISSAGLHAVVGQPLSPQARTALSEIGIPVSAHASQTLSDYDADDADLILTMTRGQKELLVTIHPQARNRTYTISEYAAGPGGIHREDVADPVGGDLADYHRTRDQILKYLREIARKISSESD